VSGGAVTGTGRPVSTFRRIGSLSGAFLVLSFGCGHHEQAEHTVLQFANHAPEVGYVGREACRSCHFEQFASFVHTGMGRSFYPMTPDEVVEDFNHANTFVVEPAGIHYRMEQRDGKLYQRQFLLDSAGREIAADDHELVYVIGSNHHCRSYVIVRDDRLFQAPVCWYPNAQRWDLCPGYELDNENFSREISLSCVHCHNARMVPEEGERNRFAKPYPHGIDCERCHGPGQLHVRRWTRGEDTPTGGLDPTIVNPRRLPREERIEVCAQCHLGDSKATERVPRRNRDLLAFRPGQRLAEIIAPYRYVEPTEHDFGLSAQKDRLLVSRCYKESNGRLECLSCHNPHVSVYHAERPPDLFRQKCLSCHAAESCPAPAADRAGTARLADDCVACHMRKAEPDDQRHTTLTDHWIRRDIRIEERDHRESHAIEPVFPERMAALPPAEALYYRGRAAGLLSLDMPRAERGELWALAESSYREAIDAGLDEAEAWFYLGKVRRISGRAPEAEQDFRRALELDPAHHDAAFALGQLLLARGATAEALDVFRGMLDRDPDDPMALAEAARATMALGNAQEALDLLDRGLRRESWSATLHLNRGRVLAQLGRFEEATLEAEAAVRLDPDARGVWDFYANVYLAAGRPLEAAEGRRVLERLGGPGAGMAGHDSGDRVVASMAP
jgi:tetratricopeptide (TPR) repeat protein